VELRRARTNVGHEEIPPTPVKEAIKTTADTLEYHANAAQKAAQKALLLEETMLHLHPSRKLTNITTIEEIVDWTVKLVVDDEESVLKACHEVGLPKDNDHLRRRSVGLPICEYWR